MHAYKRNARLKAIAIVVRLFYKVDAFKKKWGSDQREVGNDRVKRLDR